MPDRERRDAETRKRVDELAESWDQAVSRFSKWQHRFAMLVMAGVVVTLLSVGVGFLVLQGQRWDQTFDGCQRTNRITEATVGLLRDLGVDEKTIRIAERRYPHVPPLVEPPGGYEGPRSCEEFADDRVQGPKL